MKKILVINPFGIGDVLFATPVARALRIKYPDSFIGFLCNRQVGPILKNNPDINELFFYSRGDLKKIKKISRLAHLSYLLGALGHLRKIKFDLALDLSLVNHYSFVLMLIGVRQRYGFDYKRRGRFLTDKIELNGFAGKHVVDYYYDLIGKLGIDTFARKLELKVDKKDEEWAAGFLKENEVKCSVPLIGISAFGGSSWGAKAKKKQWPIEYFANIVQKIIERYKAKIILLGTENDKKESLKLENLIGAKELINAAGKTSLGQLAALIGNFKLFIGNDSGPLHMAAALDVKTVSIFGPADELVYGPVGDDSRHIVLSKSLSCRPCYKNFRSSPCQSMNCLLEVMPQDVLAAVARLL